MATYLTEHFTLEELTVTQVRGVSNTPPTRERQNLQKVAQTLEAIRRPIGALYVSSGYRNPTVNAKIGGSLNSAHLLGLAADILPLKAGLSILDAYKMIATMIDDLDLDQLIYEYGRWIHVGLNPAGKRNRRQKLMIFKAGCYVPFDESKIPS